MLPFIRQLRDGSDRGIDGKATIDQGAYHPRTPFVKMPPALWRPPFQFFQSAFKRQRLRLWAQTRSFYGDPGRRTTFDELELEPPLAPSASDGPQLDEALRDPLVVEVPGRLTTPERFGDLIFVKSLVPETFGQGRPEVIPPAQQAQRCSKGRIPHLRRLLALPELERRILGERVDGFLGAKLQGALHHFTGHV